MPFHAFVFDEIPLSAAVGRSTSWQGWGLSVGLLGWFLLPRAWRSQETRPSAWKSLAAGGAAATVAMALLMAHQEGFYKLLFYPYVVPLAAAFLASPPERTSGVVRALQALAAGLCLAGFLFFCGAVRIYGETTRPYERLALSVKALLPGPAIRVMAPAVLYFAWDPAHFRDLGALVLSHWFTGGRRDLRLWIEDWRPQALVVDEAFERAFIGPRNELASIAGYLGCPVQYLGQVDGGPSFYGTWRVYRVDWPAERRASGQRKR